MSDFYAILTAAGEALLANAAATGQTLQLDMAVGDGTGSAAQGTPVPDPQKTGLVSEQRRAPLNSLTIDPETPNVIQAEQIIPPEVGGWWIREVGLFDQSSGALVAIANVPPTYKPVLASGSGRTQVVRLQIVVENADAVSIKIDPNVFLASRQWVAQRLSWAIVDTANTLSVGSRNFLTDVGPYVLPAPATVSTGVSIIVASRGGIESVITVADASDVLTSKGADPEIIIAGDACVEFVMTGTQWEV